MSQSALSCPKCNGEMVLGYQMESAWFRGLPRIPAFIKAVSWEIFKLPGEKEYVPIGTYRCNSCGFLESYAREEFAAQ